MFRRIARALNLDDHANGILDSIARNPLPILGAALAIVAPQAYAWGTEYYANAGPEIQTILAAVGAAAGMVVARWTYSARKVLADLMDADTAIELAREAGVPEGGEPQGALDGEER